MKKLFSTVLVSTMCVGAMLFVSCSNEGDLGISQSTNGESELITTKINLGGEYSISYSDLRSKAETTSTDLYGIQVFTKNETDSVPYACGVFDDPNQMSVDLIKGNKYIIWCRYIKDGKNQICLYSKDIPNRYDDPFLAYRWTLEDHNGILYADNTMTYSTTFNLERLVRNWGIARLTASDDCNQSSSIVSVCYDRPNIESYSGEVHNFDPTTGNININLKKVFFGVKLNVENLTEGSLVLTITQSKGIQILSTDESKTQSRIITFDGGPTSNWTDDDYSESVNTKAIYKNASGIETEIFNQNLTYYRNKETTINITIPSNTTITSKSVGISTETTDMTSSDTNYSF